MLPLYMINLAIAVIMLFSSLRTWPKYENVSSSTTSASSWTNCLFLRPTQPQEMKHSLPFSRALVTWPPENSFSLRAITPHGSGLHFYLASYGLFRNQRRRRPNTKYAKPHLKTSEILEHEGFWKFLGDWYVLSIVCLPGDAWQLCVIHMCEFCCTCRLLLKWLHIIDIMCRVGGNMKIAI